MSWRAGSISVEVVAGDLTQQDVDAIVNAANNDLQLGGGVAGAIARAGGPEIQQDCDRIGAVAVGDAAISTGGRLKAKHVIHAASMQLGGRTTSDALRRSTARSLELAQTYGLQSVAFPAVGTGIARFPLDDCARIMVEEVVKAATTDSSLRLVRFVLFGAEAEAAFRREAERQLS